MTAALALLRQLEHPEFFRALAPSLAMSDRVPVACPSPQPPLQLGNGGFAVVEGALTPARSREMCDAIDALHAQGLPLVLAYVYDAFWEPLASLAALASHELGAYDVLADAWAFRVPPGRRGWTAHRGLSTYEGGRTTLNAWVSLTHATAKTSCIHLVPLDRDPAYPDDLASVRVPDGTSLAIETGAGDALVWDANTLHWGGEMAAEASEPRRSVTYTLRKTSHRRAELPHLDLSTLDFRARLDLAAHEILKYASQDPMAPELVEWASVTALTQQMGKRLHP